MDDDNQSLARDPILGLALVLGENRVVPFVPTRKELIPRILDELQLGRDDIFYDLGCGDGRVAIYAAKHYGVKKAVCVEIDENLAREALVESIRQGIGDRVSVINADFREIKVHDATAIYLYLLPVINEVLREKFESEIENGARIAALDFPIPGWVPVKTIELDMDIHRVLYIYKI